MTLSDLASIGSLVSGVAVLVSLVYLGAQIRQNTLAHRIATRQSSADFAREHFGRLTNPDLAALYLRGLDGDPTLTEIELFQFSNLVRDVLAEIGQYVWQRDAGVIEDDELHFLNRGLRLNFRFPGFRAMASLSRWQLSDEARRYVDEALADTHPKPPPFSEGWQAAVAAQRNAKRGSGE